MIENTLPLGIKPINGKPYQCMIVDDSLMMRKLLNRILLSVGFEVMAEADSGKAVIDIYNNNSVEPDFMFVDIEMPEMNGVDTVKHLKSKGAKCKIIMCTSVTNNETVKELVALGIAGYIVKPFDRDKVIKSLIKIIQ